jgi:hypothetical protein
MTRANLAALQFDFARAFELHPLFFYGAIGLAAAVAVTLKPALARSRIFTAACAALAAVYLALYAARLSGLSPFPEELRYDDRSLFGLIKKFLSRSGK